MLLSSLVIKVMIIWFIVFFILSQVMIEKKWLPAKFMELRLLYLCIASIGLIFLSIVIGILIKQPVFIVGTVTILCSSVLSFKYRNKFDHIKRG
ncbi:hypothetical protein UAW_02417 [Enterococcus haemoperoxidus ATCC BAA-382]|uniref:Uncharacterized protein n=1 Tax=Enterococcus haemoperoxidus ATCC BAA-382 TaxID=1158608 RepID=R2SMB8_9ENTE|nr:hypothetical protein UAW_02417 [Enterococcus haemoperoxidus ATCC BAA-382]EOT63304.1 hypothetical protein I583_00104 [Enterococcus haemoperoxidus ATCC BAA-382]